MQKKKRYEEKNKDEGESVWQRGIEPDILQISHG